MMRKVRGRITYSNVMATVAVFIALGGTTYAATKINGAQIKNRSIAGKKLKPNSLTAKEVRSAGVASRTKQLVVSERPRTRAASSTGDNLIRLDLGQSATLIESGPFTLTLTCVKDRVTDPSLPDYGKPMAEIIARTDEDNTLIDGVSGGYTGEIPDTIDAGQNLILATGDHRRIQASPGHAIMIAPSGAQLDVNYFRGSEALGADCYASAYAVV